MAHQIATLWFELQFQKFVDDLHKNSIWQKTTRAIILAGRRYKVCPTTSEAKPKNCSSLDKFSSQTSFAMLFVRIYNFTIALLGCLGFYIV